MILTASESDKTKANEIIKLLTVDDCSMTYAEYLSPGYQLYEFGLMAISVLFMLIFSVRMYQLHKYALNNLASKNLFDTKQFRFYLIGLIASTFFFIESLDMLGFSDRLPPDVYFLADEVVTSTVVIFAVEVSDFWAYLALTMKKTSAITFSKAIRISLYTIVVVNYIGWIIVGICLYDNYFMFEGIKTFVGGLILIGLIGRVWINYRTVKRVLLNAAADNVTNSSSDNTHNHGSKNQGQASDVERPKVSEVRIKTLATLRRKFAIYTFVAILGCLVQIFNSINVWGLLNDPGVPVDLRWQYKIHDQLDIAQIIIKVIFVCVFLMDIYFFGIPKSEKSRGAVVDSHSHSTTPDHGRGEALFKSTKAVLATYKQPSAHSSTIETSMRQIRTKSTEFRQIFMDPTRSDKFRRFLESKHAAEAFLFCVEVKDFEKIEDDNERINVGKSIVSKYIADNGPSVITILDAERRKLITERDFPITTFRAAEKECVDLLQNNFYGAFIEVEKDY